MSRGSRARAVPVVALVLLASLVSCAPRDAARPDVARAGRPSPDVTLNPAAPDPYREDALLYVGLPERPADLDRRDERGAEAAVRYFLDLFGYLHSGDDETAWQEMSHPDCAFCAEVAGNVPVPTRPGDERIGGGVQDVVVDLVPSGPPRYRADVEMLQLPVVVRDATTRKVHGYTWPRLVSGVIAVVHDGDRWLIREAELEFVEDGA